MRYRCIGCVVVPGFVLLLSGCFVTGVSPREVGRVTYSELVYGLYSGRAVEETKPAIRTPLVLAVAQVGETSPPAALLSELRRCPELISRVVEVPLPGEVAQPSYYHAPANDTPERRQTFQERARTLVTISRDLGADYVFMVGGHIDSRTLESPLTVVNIAILPLVLVPTMKVKIEANASGAFIDVRTGSIVFLVNTQSKGEGITPPAFEDQKRESLSLAQKAVLSKQIGEALVERLQAAR